MNEYIVSSIRNNMKADTMNQEKSYEMNGIFIQCTHLSTFKGVGIYYVIKNRL